MAGKKRTNGKRPYRHPKALTGFREPDRDYLNFAELDRALTAWLVKNDPNYTAGCCSSHFIDHNT